MSVSEVNKTVILCSVGWLQPFFRQQWLKMLLVDQRLDTG